MPTFTEIGTSIGELVEKKNKAYGNAFAESSKILEILFPGGVPVEKYCDLLTVTRILDKLFRIATDKNAFNEEPFKDIAGYAILAVQRQNDEVEKNSRTARGPTHKTVGVCNVCSAGYERPYEITVSKLGMCDACYVRQCREQEMEKAK